MHACIKGVKSNYGSNARFFFVWLFLSSGINLSTFPLKADIISKAMISTICECLLRVYKVASSPPPSYPFLTPGTWEYH